MRVADLRARGLVENPHQQRAFTYCPPCANYQWFAVWSPPGSSRAFHACVRCGSVPQFDVATVERYPVRTTEAA